VFRREFLIEHDLKCVYGLRRQDSEFSPRALYYAKRVVPLHEVFYLYRIHGNSVSTASKDPGRFLKDWAIITRSLLAFHATVSREPDFDVRVASCWMRQWIPRLFAAWFYPFSLDHVARSRRLETLQMLFAEGFDDFDAIMKYANRSKRIAGWWLLAFVRHAALRWPAELFFRVYYRVSGMRSRKKADFRVQIAPSEAKK